jgi:hypothetical protein
VDPDAEATELDPDPEPHPEPDPDPDPAPVVDPEPDPDPVEPDPEPLAEVESEPDPEPAVSGSCDEWAGLYLSEAGDGCVLHSRPEPAWLDVGVYGLVGLLVLLAALVVSQLRR